MMDIKGLYQLRAEELALEQYDKEFYELPDAVQYEIYSLACVLVNEDLMLQAERKVEVCLCGE